MLADGAHQMGGKLYILGGQWDRLNVSQFPAQHPSMAVVLVVKVEYDEATVAHDLGIALMLDGRPVGPAGVARFTTGHAPGTARGAPTFVSTALTFPNITFETPGRYEWAITGDGEPMGQIPLAVERGPQMPDIPLATAPIPPPEE